MFNSLDARFAREDAISIARDRIGHPAEDAKARALEWIGLALEKWKCEQAADDGTVAIDWWSGLLGYRPDGMSDVPLSELTSGVTRKRVPVSEVQPHQCAGINVKCPADLVHWLWLEKYQPVEHIADKLGLDLAIALLVERDGMSMAMDSLLRSIQVLWHFQRVLKDVYRAELTAAHRRKIDTAARARAGKAERRTGAFAHAEWKRMAAEIWRADINKTRHTVVCEIRAELVRRQQTTSPDGKQRSVPAHRTVEDAIKGIQAAVRADVARAANRATQRQAGAL